MLNGEINPKDFNSYDDYLNALEIHEQFQELSAKASKAINEAESDEELAKKMEKLGFTYHEDEFCERKFCQDRGICLWVMLESFQYDCNDRFFDGLLAEKDLIFTKKDIENHFISCCRFPADWDDKNGLKYKSMMFVFDLEEAIYHSRLENIPFEKFVQKNDTKKIFRNLYMFLLVVLKQLDSDKMTRIFDEMEKLLKNNSILGKKISQKFLKKFQNIIT